MQEMKVSVQCSQHKEKIFRQKISCLDWQLRQITTQAPICQPGLQALCSPQTHLYLVPAEISSSTCQHNEHKHKASRTSSYTTRCLENGREQALNQKFTFLGPARG